MLYVKTYFSLFRARFNKSKVKFNKRRNRKVKYSHKKLNKNKTPRWKRGVFIEVTQCVAKKVKKMVVFFTFWNTVEKC